MSVLVETTLGSLTIDLYCEECPISAKNFLKLCKSKYYNNCLFFNIEADYIAQCGDPTNSGNGGESVYKQIYGDQARFFEDEFHSDYLRHDRQGLISMASKGPNTNGSQFFIQLVDRHLESLDNRHPVFGEVVEGFETLEKINAAFCDENGRPYQNIRIKHTTILYDPFEDPPGLFIPDRSPSPPLEALRGGLEEDDLKALDEGKETLQEIDEKIMEEQAKTRAIVLEMLEDLPDADIRPPDNVLFVCKLNPVTTDEDLELIFSRFGPCIAEIIRDSVTGDSLCYGFVEFESEKHCQDAFFKMDNVLIDERRIHVDFSQSVAKLWNKFHRKEKMTHADGHVGSREESSSVKSSARNVGRGDRSDNRRNRRSPHRSSPERRNHRNPSPPPRSNRSKRSSSPKITVPLVQPTRSHYGSRQSYELVFDDSELIEHEDDASANRDTKQKSHSKQKDRTDRSHHKRHRSRSRSRSRDRGSSRGERERYKVQKSSKHEERDRIGNSHRHGRYSSTSRASSSSHTDR